MPLAVLQARIFDTVSRRRAAPYSTDDRSRRTTRARCFELQIVSSDVRSSRRITVHLRPAKTCGPAPPSGSAAGLARPAGALRAANRKPPTQSWDGARHSQIHLVTLSLSLSLSLSVSFSRSNEQMRYRVLIFRSAAVLSREFNSNSPMPSSDHRSDAATVCSSFLVSDSVTYRPVPSASSLDGRLSASVGLAEYPDRLRSNSDG